MAWVGSYRLHTRVFMSEVCVTEGKHGLRFGGGLPRT